MTGFDWLIIVAWTLALARATRLINADTITDPIRIWVARRWGENGTASYFLACPWCVSMWLGLAAAPFAVWLTGLTWWCWPLLALAASYLVGMTAQLDTSENIEFTETEEP